MGVLQAHAADVQRQGVQAVLQHVDRKRALDFGPLQSHRHVIPGSDDRGRAGGVRFGRRLGLLHKVVVFLAAQQRAFRLLLQEDVEVGEGDVDFPRGTFARRSRSLGGRAWHTGHAEGKHNDGTSGRLKIEK